MADRFVSKPDNAVAFAFVDRQGFPFTDTVARSPRASMILALTMVFGITPDATWPDAKVRAAFGRCATPIGGAISPVSIERLIVVDKEGADG